VFADVPHECRVQLGSLQGHHGGLTRTLTRKSGGEKAAEVCCGAVRRVLRVSRRSGRVRGSHGVYETGEGLIGVVGGDGGVVFGLVGVEVKPGEDRLVEEFPGVVGGGVVEVARPVE
jgi:hypothetical protein